MNKKLNISKLFKEIRNIGTIPPTQPRCGRVSRKVATYYVRAIQDLKKQYLNAFFVRHHLYNTVVSYAHTKVAVKHHIERVRNIAELEQFYKFNYHFGYNSAYGVRKFKPRHLWRHRTKTASRFIRVYDKRVRIFYDKSETKNVTQITGGALVWLQDRKTYVVREDSRYPAMPIYGKTIQYVDKKLFDKHKTAYVEKYGLVYSSVEECWCVSRHTVHLGNDEGIVSRWHVDNGDYFLCRSCDTHFADAYHESDGRCSTCYPRQRAERTNYSSALISVRDENNNLFAYRNPIDKHGFNTKTVRYYPPLPGMPQRKDNARFFGVELEYEIVARTPKIKALAADITKSHWAYGGDGSLQDGVEFRSAPAGLETHRKEFNRLFSIQDGFMMKASKPTNGTGLHVHVSRNTITERVVIALRLFMANPSNKVFLDKLADRVANRWCHRTSPKGHHKSTLRRTAPTRYVPKKYLAWYSSKYQAVNTGLPNTVEFRLFKSTTNINEFMYRLQFCDAICDFLTEYPSKKMFTQEALRAAPTYKEFGVWLFSKRKYHQKLWPELMEYFLDNKYVQDTDGIAVSSIIKGRKLKYETLVPHKKKQERRLIVQLRTQAKEVLSVVDPPKTKIKARNLTKTTKPRKRLKKKCA